MGRDPLARLDQLIAEGEGLPIDVVDDGSGGDPGEATLRHRIDQGKFGGWVLSCTSYLTNLLPEESSWRFLLQKTASLEPGPEARAYLLEQLRGIREAVANDALG